MSSLKDIMDVDVEPLESQAYRRSREAAQEQASRPPIAPSSETTSPSIDDHDNKGKTPLKRRRSNRVSKPPSQPTAARQNSTRRRSSAAGEGMEPYGFQAGASNQASNSGSPQQSSRGSEPATDMPVKYTPVTGRISRAKKGVPVHTCDICRPVKTFTRAEHLRRHQLSHQKPAYPCTFEDCERAFHRPDLLARHLHRHETQGEKAYKSGDPRSRASSSASESRTPSLKVETPSQGAVPAAPQISPTDSMTPRTSGSGESSMTASSFNTIVTNFQAVNFSPGSGSSHKRSRSQAELPDADSYHPISPGAGKSRAPGNYNQLSDQTNFSRPEDFGGGFSEGGSTQLSGYTTTPQLPLLSIPELSYTQENSPWCSSASDSTYSTQSDGPRNPPGWGHRGRSASIATSDWHWSTHGITTTPQDLQSPAFDSIMEQYELPPYVSPRMTPPGSTRGHLLDVPNSFVQLGHYMDMESVGTPALSTYCKPLAQLFPASPTRVSNSGLASIGRRQKELVNPLEATTPTFPPKPQYDIYVSSYWQYFHPHFPIIHRPTCSYIEDSLLTYAMAAIGTQYHYTSEARTKGIELNETCRKNIDLQPNWTLQTMQAILLTEIFTRFRGRKTNVRLSRHFDALFLRLLDDQGQPTFVDQSPGDARSADSLLDQFGTPSNMRTVQTHDAQIEWDQWREAEARRRLLSSVWFFDWWQATFHQQPRSKAAAEETRSLLCLPCPDTVWDASTEVEWSTQRQQTGYYVPQPLQMVEQNVSMYSLDTSTFTESLLFCWFVPLLPAREQLPPNNQPNIGNLMSLFSSSPLTNAYFALCHTPLNDLLSVAGDTWVFGQKVPSPSMFQSAQAHVKTWCSSLSAAQATHYACRILSDSLSQSSGATQDNHTESTVGISDYWNLYIAALITWAFHHKYQTSTSTGSGSGTLSRSNSSTALGSVDVDAPISDDARIKALTYANGMLELGVEDLIANKANLKAETLSVIDAVRHRLEIESVGNRCGLLVDAIGVLKKLSQGRRGKWF